MAKIDELYFDTLKDILNNGISKKDRTGIGTLSIFGKQLKYEMKYGFPLLTTKKLHIKSIIYELLWFLKGDTNIRFLNQNGVTIWNEWPYKRYLIYCQERKIKNILSEKEFINKIIEDDAFAKEFGELGPIYGKQWVNWNNRINQIKYIIEKLKYNPDDRRMIVNAWNPDDIDKMLLPPCHYNFQIYTRELNIKDLENIMQFNNYYDLGFNMNQLPQRSISLMWNQRSADVFLGLPFDIASYAILLLMFAQQFNMIPEYLICNLGDTHIYNNHIYYVQELLKRDSNKYIAPKFKMIKAKDIFLYKYEDFIITDYQAYPNWKGVPVAV